MLKPEEIIAIQELTGSSIMLCDSCYHLGHMENDPPTIVRCLSDDRNSDFANGREARKERIRCLYWEPK